MLNAKLGFLVRYVISKSEVRGNICEYLQNALLYAVVIHKI